MSTIKDVARLAGVSPATASQALNGRPRVNADTRERVVAYRVVLGGVAETTHGRGYSLVITPAPRDGMRPADLVRLIGHGAVDGALVVGVLEAEWLFALRECGLPVALVDTYLDGSTVPAVVADYRDGARQATAHLLRLGHRRVAFLGAAVTCATS